MLQILEAGITEGDCQECSGKHSHKEPKVGIRLSKHDLSLSLHEKGKIVILQ
jgi:hypothetical protein